MQKSKTKKSQLISLKSCVGVSALPHMGAYVYVDTHSLQGVGVTLDLKRAHERSRLKENLNEGWQKVGNTWGAISLTGLKEWGERDYQKLEIVAVAGQGLPGRGWSLCLHPPLICSEQEAARRTQVLALLASDPQPVLPGLTTPSPEGRIPGSQDPAGREEGEGVWICQQRWPQCTSPVHLGKQWMFLNAQISRSRKCSVLVLVNSFFDHTNSAVYYYFLIPSALSSEPQLLVQTSPFKE